MHRHDHGHEFEDLPAIPQKETEIAMAPPGELTHGNNHNAYDDDGHQTSLAESNECLLPSADQMRIRSRTVRKLDLILLPFLALLFLLNSLDKSNIGNAETAGFTKDTGLSRSDINISMSVFFSIFVLLQPVGAALGRNIGMAIYVPTCMSLWGLTTLLHIFIRRRWQLLTLRVILAILESGFYPTTVSYLSLFYTKYEFGVRIGIFYGMTAVSGALGGILSWAVFSHFPGHDHSLESTASDDAASPEWKSWQVLFLIEGCTTILVALIGFLWLPHSAQTAWFLNRLERSWAEERMKRDRSSLPEMHKESIAVLSDRHEAGPSTTLRSNSNIHDESTQRLLDDNDPGSDDIKPDSPSPPVTADAGLTRQDVLSAIFNLKVWHLLVVNILSAIPATAFGVLLPVVVNELSPSLQLSPAASNLLTVPPFACGAIVLYIFTYWSDRLQQRVAPILYGLGLLLAGLIMTILAPVERYWLRYFSLCILLSGSFIASPLTVAWLANNTPQPGKRAIMLGINGWGNFAGVFLAILFTPEDRKNGYIRSFVILLISTGAALTGFIVFWILLVRENKWREDILRSWSDEEKEREDTHGDVELPSGRVRSRTLTDNAFARLSGLQRTRKGDERITFRYGL